MTKKKKNYDAGRVEEERGSPSREMLPQPRLLNSPVFGHGPSSRFGIWGLSEPLSSGGFTECFSLTVFLEKIMMTVVRSQAGRQHIPLQS